MFKMTRAFFSVGFVLLALGILSAPISAQTRDTVRAPCCRCLDGKETSTVLDTGTAPWKLAGPGITGVVPAVPVGRHPSWTSALAPGKWVADGGGARDDRAAGTFKYVLQIFIPKCIIGAPVTISGRFAADNSADLYLDNSMIATQGSTNVGFKAGQVASFSATISSAGMHTLTVKVANESGPSAMVLAGRLSSVCPKELEYR